MRVNDLPAEVVLAFTQVGIHTDLLSIYLGGTSGVVGRLNDLSSFLTEFSSKILFPILLFLENCSCFLPFFFVLDAV